MCLHYLVPRNGRCIEVLLSEHKLNKLKCWIWWHRINNSEFCRKEGMKQVTFLNDPVIQFDNEMRMHRWRLNRVLNYICLYDLGSNHCHHIRDWLGNMRMFKHYDTWLLNNNGWNSMSTQRFNCLAKSVLQAWQRYWWKRHKLCKIHVIKDFCSSSYLEATNPWI